MRTRLAVAVVAFTCASLPAQRYPGQRTYGSDDYVEYVAGSLPVLLTSGHGGGLEPAEIPDRTYGVTTQDARTEELARELAEELAARTGRYPHLVISHLHRSKLDPNREIVEAAQGDPRAEQAWREFHAYIDFATSVIETDWGGGVYLDLHGHGHAIARIEWGYALNGTDLSRTDAALDAPAYVNLATVKHAATLPGARLSQVVRGPFSFGTWMHGLGYPSVPSAAIPSPGSDPYFTGGYNVRRHGSRDGGTVDAVQVEFQSNLRRVVSLRRAMIPRLADTIAVWLDRQVGIDASADPKISIEAVEALAHETGRPAVLRLRRTGDVSAARTVLWGVVGTATNGVDVRSLPSMVTFSAGRATVDVEVQALADGLDEGDETLAVHLFGGPEIGWPAHAEVVVRDAGDDPGLAVDAPLDLLQGSGTPDAGPRGTRIDLLPSAVAGPRPTAGVDEGALAFDGVDDGLDLHLTDFAPTESFTLSFWFRTPPPTAGQSGYRYIVSNDLVGRPSSLNVYVVEDSSTLRTALSFQNDRTPLEQLDVAATAFLDGNWHHYALAANPRGLSQVFLDGELQRENVHSGDRFDPLNRLFVGGRVDRNPSRFFPGALDELRVHERASSAAEIRGLFELRRARVADYGSGCPAGSAPSLEVEGRPEVGASFDAVLRTTAAKPSFLGLGLRVDLWSGRTLPFDLTALGAPGCLLLHDLLDAPGGMSDAQGIRRFALTVPSVPAMRGRSLYLQGIVFDPGANVLGLGLTQGIAVHLGGSG